MSRLRVLAFASVLLLSLVPACAGDDDQVKKDVKELGRTLGEAGREVGHAAGEAGKEIGRAGKEVGLEVADAAKKVWYRGKEVSAPLLADMRRATREFWDNVLERKDETLRDLRRKNEELKRRSGGAS